ncbi:MAG: YceD family protein [Eubacteriales bacterium]
MLDSLQIDMASVLAGEVDTLPIDGTFSMDETQDYNGAHFLRPVCVVGNVTNRAGYIRLSVNVTADYSALCARCLKPIEGQFVSSVEKTVAVRGTLADEDADEIISDYVLIENGILDLPQIVSEQLCLELPYRFLCREDCRGLCPKCGKDRNEGDCGCPEKEPDPRLAPLRALLEK